MNSSNKTVYLELNSSMMTNTFFQLFKRSELAEGCADQLMTIHSQVLLTCHPPPLKTHHQCKAIFQLGIKEKHHKKLLLLPIYHTNTAIIICPALS